jgi:DNA-binding HxlR family transcriptional regulator
MQRVSFKHAQCPIARGLDQVGEWWSLLILRDAFDGFTRFDEFERSLKIGPTMLSRRLKTLVDAGLLERRCYSEHPPRFEYVLTERGREFRPVLLALYAWVYRHTSPAERSVVLVEDATGREVEPLLVDRATGRPLEELDVSFAPGPAAGESLRERMTRRSRSCPPILLRKEEECHP